MLKNFQTLDAQRTELVRWLLDDALPVWEAHGVDRERGGFFESLAFDPVTGNFGPLGEIRRGRVVARQMYSFGVGHELGWQRRHPNAVEHGCDFLYSRLLRDTGIFHTALRADSNQIVAPFSLYEHAFYLFALARAKASMEGVFPIETTAVRCLQQLREGFAGAYGGFEESSPPTLPLKSNPHMHMLEAALAWITVSAPSQQAAWVALAEEIVALCLTRFIDPSTGALREYFDEQWRPMPDASGRIVEPGHQFEWGWLLFCWGSLDHCSAEQRQACYAAARKLIQIGEQRGVDAARGVAFNELWDDLTPKDLAAKIWPQTERVKAWCCMLQHAENPAEADIAVLNLSAGIQGLTRYLTLKPAGLWRETLSPDGVFTSEACKASSFYHIVCAIETVDQTLKVLGGPAAD
jgi:mannose-6-phosphate isomerase